MDTPILTHYANLGIAITANGDKLRLAGLSSAITPEIQNEIASQRACIFFELSQKRETMRRSPETAALADRTVSDRFETVGDDETISATGGQEKQCDVAAIHRQILADWTRQLEASPRPDISAGDVLRRLPSGKISRQAYLQAWDEAESEHKG